MDLKITYIFSLGKWSCTLLQYDMGDPVGYGKTIPRAIDDFMEMWLLVTDEELSTFKWN